ncbi:hypothetical protein Tco_0353857, partial [Tanacetum coccineum]
MNLNDLRGKRRRLMRKLKLSGRSLHKKLRTWLYKKELLRLAYCASPHDGLSLFDPTNPEQDDSEIPPLEDIYQNSPDGIFTNSSYDDEGAVADFTNLETIIYLLVSCLKMNPRRFQKHLKMKVGLMLC